MTDYVVNGATPLPNLPLTEFLSSLPCGVVYDMKQQFEIWSSVSNNHWRQYMTVFGGQSSATVASHPSLVRHMSYTGTGSLPASRRNRLIYFLANGNKTQAHITIDELLSCCSVDRVQVEISEDDVADESVTQPPPPKRARKVVTVTENVFSKEVAENLHPAAARSSYHEFRERIVLEGTLFWRFHSSEEDVFVLNDYRPETGDFLPFSFVHVCRVMSGGCALYTCSCQMYNWLRQKVMSDADNSSDVVITGITCMHCRFMTEEFEPKSRQLLDGSLPASSPINSRLLESKCSLNHGVVLLSPPSSATYKFSVRCKSGTGLPLSFVHLSKSCEFIFCLFGECRANRGSKKKVQHLVTDSQQVQTGFLCQHLEMMRANVDTWKSLIPGHADVTVNEMKMDSSMTDNTDDSDLTPAAAENEAFLKVSKIIIIIIIYDLS
jgi:hypothetical protein